MAEIPTTVKVNAKALTAFGTTFTVQIFSEKLNIVVLYFFNGLIAPFKWPENIVETMDWFATWTVVGLVSLGAAWLVRRVPNLEPPNGAKP